MIRPRIVLLSILINLVLNCSAVLAEAPPELNPFEAVYAVHWRGIPAGETIHRLRKVGNDRYSFDTRTEPLLPILPFRYHESTQYVWRERTIQPQYFQYTHREGKKHREGTIIFDWLTGQISSRLEGEPWPTVLQTGIQDKLTHSLMLRYDLKYRPGSHYSYLVADDDTIKNYDFETLKEGPLNTALGTVHAVLLRNISVKGRETQIWFAKEYDYLPVRLLQYRNGKLQTEVVIKKYSEAQHQNKD